MSDPKPLKNRLHEARVAAGLSRRKLSLRAELAQAVVGQIERGDTVAPRLETLEKLADVLNVSREWLAFGAQPPAPPASRPRAARARRDSSPRPAAA